HHMEIGPTEAEGAGAGATRVVERAMNPRTSLSVDIKRRIREVGAWIGLADAERGREYPVVQRQRDLDQPGDPGGRLGVSDHRLDRADRRLLPFGIGRVEKG